MSEKVEIVFEDQECKIVIMGAYLYEVIGSSYKKIKPLQRMKRI